MSDPESQAGENIARPIPSAQFLRYLLIGAWNTVFGYTCFFLMNRWLATVMPAYSYIAANLAANFIAITVAFLGYKWFVFRTKGNYLREWLRTWMVYSASVIFSTLALAPLVGLIRHTTRYQTQAPYIAGAVVAIFTVLSSFFGHRHFSFRKASAAIDEPKKLER
jgi:putative flippase GtrA